MATSSAGQWVKFFNSSGIPSPAAATYAHIFVENRIQIDMLMDLNKEYLREMGISLMGDIIAILRHAKRVSDQTARDKVLCSEISVPIAAVLANPIAPPDKNSTKIHLSSSTMSSASASLKSAPAVVVPLPKAPRRVLPEHEGKYKIKLPSGTTERSKEILAKKAKLYADIEGSKKPCVFDRLDRNKSKQMEDGELSSSTQDVRICIAGLGKSSASTSSIFSRLGGKSSDSSYATAERSLRPILKNSPKSSLSGIVKAKTITASPLNPRKQKVLLVKKVPLKRESPMVNLTNNNSDSENDCTDEEEVSNNYSTGSEKFVKFASQAEVREIAATSARSKFKKEPSAAVKAANRNRNFGSLSVGTVKSRLGNGMHADKMHATQKNFKLKSSPARQEMRISPSKALRLKSDEITMRRKQPIYSRLGSNGSGGDRYTSEADNARKTISKLSNRIGKVSLSSASSKRGLSTGASLKLATASGNNNSSSSVFDRLGYNG